MSITDLNSAVSKMKRFIHKSVISGSFSDTELEYYIQDANSIVGMDLPDYGSYTITVGGGIEPSPTATDLTLLSMQASILLYTSILQESVADAVMVKAGSISLDTSKSLRGISDALNALKSRYTTLVDDILINGSTSSSGGGARIDVYLEVKSDTNNENSEYPN